MEVLNNFFTLQKVMQIGGVVFSFFSFVVSIQVYVNIRQVVGTVQTKRNGGFKFISLSLVIISILLFISAFIFL